MKLSAIALAASLSLAAFPATAQLLQRDHNPPKAMSVDEYRLERMNQQLDCMSLRLTIYDLRMRLLEMKSTPEPTAEVQDWIKRVEEFLAKHGPTADSCTTPPAR